MPSLSAGPLPAKLNELPESWPSATTAVVCPVNGAAGTVKPPNVWLIEPPPVANVLAPS